MSSEIDPVDISELCIKLQRQADILFEDRQLKESLQLVLSGLKIDPYSPALLRQAGNIYYEMFCEVAALQIFEKLVELYDNEGDKISLETIRRTISQHYTCKIYS